METHKVEVHEVVGVHRIPETHKVEVHRVEDHKVQVRRVVEVHRVEVNTVVGVRRVETYRVVEVHRHVGRTGVTDERRLRNFWTVSAGSSSQNENDTYSRSNKTEKQEEISPV